mgnify:CR=1 FL=1
MERQELPFVKSGEMYFVAITAERWRKQFFWESLFGAPHPVFGKWIIYQALRKR